MRFNLMKKSALYALKIWMVILIIPAIIMSIDYYFRIIHLPKQTFNLMYSFGVEEHFGLYLIFSSVFSSISIILFFLITLALSKKPYSMRLKKKYLSMWAIILTFLAFSPVYYYKIDQVQWFAIFVYLSVIISCIFSFKFPEILQADQSVPGEIIDHDI